LIFIFDFYYLFIYLLFLFIYLKTQKGILLWLYSGGSMGDIYSEVSKKSLKEVLVSWKSLVFIHNLIQQGPNSTISHSASQLKLFQNMSSFWSTSKKTEIIIK